MINIQKQARKLKRAPCLWFLVEEKLFFGFLAKHVETEELGLVVGVLALKLSVGNFAAFDELSQTDQLAEFALQIKTVTLIGYQKYITLAGVDYSEKFFYINIMKIYVCHTNYLLMFYTCFVFVSLITYYTHYSIDFRVVNRFFKIIGIFLGNL